MSQVSPIAETTLKREKSTRQNNSQQMSSVDHLLKQPSEKSSSFHKRAIRLGVCAMEKKTTCKPMQEILNRLSTTEDIVIIIFPEQMILHSPIQDWPIVDCLITFHSSGFPLAKAEAYVELRKPYLINELKFQESLLWRHKVYEILVRHGIPVPKHYIVIDEKTAKRSKKQTFFPSSSERVDENFKYQTHQISSKFMLNGSESEDPESFGNRNSISQASQSEKENPVHIINPDKKVEEDAELTNKEEEKSESQLDDETKSTYSISRQYAQSLTKSNTQEAPTEPSVLRRKYSEHSFPPKLVRIESQSEEELSRSELYKQPLFSSTKKYYTKIEEHDDFIMIGEHKLSKPFVEKPLNAEDHQINIYYPRCDGGGCKCLFRKTNNVSSSFDPNADQIRRGESFLYEEFLPTEGFDIKVYTVGPNYAHAEARKSPVLDGVVQRTKDGKEVRFPVNLTYEEKIIAKKIVFAFDQQICGFDLLRSKGKSYVCDVNGWSFVKGNQKYYTDCAMLIRGMIFARFAPERLTPLNPILSQLNTIKYNVDVENMFRPNPAERGIVKEELRSVVTIFRHGDRTPKQKMKMITTDPKYLTLFEDQPDKKKEVKLKTKKQLQKVLDRTQEIVEQFQASNFRLTKEFTSEMASKLLQLYSVLKKGGHFEGINRKIQIKPLEWEQSIDPVSGEKTEVVTKGLFILKWGGELTHSGIEQAEELGAIFRTQVYPQDNEGILRLHSTYRHDLKIYSSQEGRCQKTAAAFCKGLLELEGDLRPILVSMVRKDEVSQELLEFNKTQESMTIHDLKDRLPSLMNSNESLYDSVAKIIGEEKMDASMRKILKEIGKPLLLLKRTHELVKKLAWNIKKALATDEDSYYLSLHDIGHIFSRPQGIKVEKKSEANSDDFPCEEVTILVYKRWKKLESDFYRPKEGIFDISKVPDIYYSIRYDILHTKRLVEANREICTELFDCSGKLAHFVIPAEYGLSDQERIVSGLHIVSDLLKKVKHDLIWWNSPFLSQTEQVVKDEHSFLVHKGLDPSKVGEDVKSLWRHVRTRLYFTSASHLYSLYNVISLGLKMFYPDSDRFRALQQLTSLEFLSHIMIRLYENLNAKQEDPNRFRLEILLSQGCVMEDTMTQKGEHSVPIAPSTVLSSQLTLQEVEEFLNSLVKLGNEGSLTNEQLS